MNSKVIILLISLHFNNSLIGMEIEPKTNIIQLLKTLPNEVKKIILSHEKQWCCVNARSGYHGVIVSAAVNHHNELLAILGIDQIDLYDIQQNEQLASTYSF